MESPKEQIQRVKKGLSIQFFNDICKDIELAENHLARIILSAPNSLAIRKKEGVFSLSESERLFRIRRIYIKALETFKDKKVVSNWFKNPYWFLDNVAPIDYLDTEIGGREVEDILNFIKKGAFTFSLGV